MGSSSSRFASCAESILTGTTKREQWLEERCTELARQNEQLRTKMLHGDVVEPFAGVTRQASTPYIERGGAPATTPAANYELNAESGLEASQHGGSALLSRLARQGSYVSSSTDLAALAVAAAARHTPTCVRAPQTPLRSEAARARARGARRTSVHFAMFPAIAPIVCSIETCRDAIVGPVCFVPQNRSNPPVTRSRDQRRAHASKTQAMQHLSKAGGSVQHDEVRIQIVNQLLFYQG